MINLFILDDFFIFWTRVWTRLQFWLMKQSSQLCQSPDDDSLMSSLWLGLNYALPDVSDDCYTWQCVLSGRDTGVFLFLNTHCPLCLWRAAADFLSSAARSMWRASAISAFVTDTKRQSLARLSKPPAVRAWGAKPEEYVKFNMVFLISLTSVKVWSHLLDEELSCTHWTVLSGCTDAWWEMAFTSVGR